MKSRIGKFALASASFAVTGSLGFLAWARLPPHRERKLHEEVLEAALERHQRYQKNAQAIEKNAFLSEAFRGFWDPAEQAEQNTTLDTVQEWLSFFPDFWKEPAQITCVFKTDQDFLNAKCEFSRLTERLEEEFKKELFLSPGDLATRASPTINSDRLSLLAHAIYRLAETYHSAGAFRRTLSTLLLSVRMASLVQRGGGCSEKILGKGIQRKNFQAMTSFFSPKVSFESKDWELLSSSLLDSLSEENSLSSWIEDAIAAVRVERWPRRVKVSDIGVSPFFSRTLQKKEERQYCNAQTDLLLAVRSGEGPLSAPVSELFPPQFLLDSMVHLTYLEQKEFLGLGVAACILAYRLKHGQFPTRLEELNLNLDFTGWNWEPNGILFIPLSEHIRVEQKVACEWLTADECGWTYRLN